MMNKIKLLNNIEKYTIITTVFLYPLIILTNFSNIFEAPKLFLLLISLLIIFTCKVLKLFLSNEPLKINLGKYDLFSVSIALTFILSSIFMSPNKVDAFFLPGTTSFVVISTLFYFLINQIKQDDKKVILNTVLVSGFIMAIIQIVSFFGITKIVPFLPEIVKAITFNPMGNLLSSIAILISLIPFLIERLIKNTDYAEKILSGLVLLVFCVSIATSIYLALPNKEGGVKILNPKFGWSIAIDSLKINPLLGVGPSNFSFAFNKFRPIAFNTGNDWNLKYLQGSSSLVTMFTETGIAGLISIALLIYLIIRNRSFKKYSYISGSLFLITMLILPVSVTAFFIFFILLALDNKEEDIRTNHIIGKIPKIFVALPVTIFSISLIYFSIKFFYAEYLFSKSIISLNKNEGLSAYELVNRAVKINPYTDRYHLLSSAINIALAENLAKKTDITEEDRKNISQLIQQSIREGKASVAVNSSKSANWESLSAVYQTIFAFADGADTFALESLNQAIALDPINPLLRIKLGSLYFSLGKYDLATDTLKLAVLAKPDLANAHYNLALVYKENKQLDKAKEELKNTLSLVGKNTQSEDYEKILKELQNIEELSKPQELPEPIIEPQIELPQEESSEPQI